MLKHLMSALRTLLDDMASGTAVALLLTGPGFGPVCPADRVWSKSLNDMAERFAVPLETDRWCQRRIAPTDQCRHT